MSRIKWRKNNKRKRRRIKIQKRRIGIQETKMKNEGKDEDFNLKRKQEMRKE